MINYKNLRFLLGSVILLKNSSYEVNWDIAECFGYKIQANLWKPDQYRDWESIPDFTGSIDAIVNLIYSTMTPQNVVINFSGQPRASIITKACVITGCHSIEGEYSAPIALCITFIQCMISIQDNELKREQ